jgi:hypothetical protein
MNLANFELPQSPIPLAQTQPGRLLSYNVPLGYFASAPKRLAPHIALAAHPHEPRTIGKIASELIQVATPRVNFSEEDVAHVQYRLELLFKPVGWDPAYYATSASRKHSGEVVHNEAGQSVVPLIALLAGRWLADRELTEKLMPASATRRYNHGMRLACLQHCLTSTTVNSNFILTDREVKKEVPKSLLPKLAREGLLVPGGECHAPSYSVSEHFRSPVADMAASIQGLADPAYAEALRTDVVSRITQTPGLYGALAHAALTEIVASARPRTRPKAVGAGAEAPNS